MQYSISKSGPTATVVITGDLTFEVQQDFRAMLRDLGDTGGSKWVLDIRKLGYIDSAGLGLLLRAKAAAEKTGATAALHPPAEGQVMDILDIAQFEQMFEFL